jgi:hypothetical protein
MARCGGPLFTLTGVAMQKHKLTGWLILFLVWVCLTGVNGLGALASAEAAWKPHMADFPSLHGAVLLFQFLTSAGIVAWLYSAWVLYQRESGTLKRAQIALVAGAVLRVFGLWSIVLFGGLPQTAVRRLAPQAGFGTSAVLLFTGIWCFYLFSSKRVREIYAEEPAVGLKQ